MPRPSSTLLSALQDACAVKWNPAGRTRSILLDDSNPIVHPLAYKHRKRLSPHNQPTSEIGEARQSLFNDIHCRMLSSPVRSNLLNRHPLPKDFLIRLSTVEHEVASAAKQSNRPSVYVVPDGLEHPKFCSQRSNRGFYLSCSRDMFRKAVADGKLASATAGARTHSLLEEQIGHQLQLRVIQETILLGDRLKALPSSSLDRPVLRRLQADDWVSQHANTSEDSSQLVAILSFQPPSRSAQSHPASRDTSLTSVLSTGDMQTTGPSLSLSSPAWLSSEAHQIPIYHLRSICADSNLREQLREALERTLELAQSKLTKEASPSLPKVVYNPSHAYALGTATPSMHHVDTVPLAISLRRLKLWLGEEDAGAPVA